MSKIFLQSFLKNPRQTGSIVPSSVFLVKKLTDPVDYEKSKILVEFGAGNGVVTKTILRKMRDDAILVCIEIEEKLCREIKKKIKDPRLKLICGGAGDLGDFLRELKIEQVDYIISELPLVSLPAEMVENILISAKKYLKPDGKYIQMQYSLLGLKKLKRHFSEVKISFTPLNIPPSFVYICSLSLSLDEC